jgi:hypothetical protein
MKRFTLKKVLKDTLLIELLLMLNLWVVFARLNKTKYYDKI